MLNYQRHLFQERQIHSVTSNTRADARAFLDFVGKHHITVTTPEYPLDQADRALSDLSAGRISGAAVLLCSEASARQVPHQCGSQRPGPSAAGAVRWVPAGCRCVAVAN